MIPVLYKANATSFSTYGIGALADVISCEVTEERNGIYECILKYPITGANYAEIKKERLIKAKPNDTSAPQAFRIYRITTPINGIVTVYAQHISYDLSAIATTPWASDPITPQLAVEHTFENALTSHNFSFRTDYTEPKAFTVTKPKSLRAVLGGESGSLLDMWGGEFEWDNFNVIHHHGRGRNNGVVIEYGKNLTNLEHDADNSDVYTDLLPFAVVTDESENETVITLSEQILPIASSNTQRKTLIKDFTDSFETDTVITEELLREKAQKYLQNNPLGVEAPTLKISFEALWKQPEYAAVLERVSLCDTVKVRHSELGVSVHSKVIKTVYDSLAEKYVSITLGNAKASLLSAVSETKTAVESITHKVDRFPSLMTSAIGSATKLITGQKGGYVVLQGDSETSQPYELLILDKPSIEEAVNVWRWNVGGLGFSSHGYNGSFETAITSDGQIVADFITTGSLVANIIKAGVLSSQDGSSFWNLETGEVVMRAYATTSSVTETNSRIDEIEEQKMYRLVISSTNGNIFKNNNIQTTLQAMVFSWDENITDQLDDNQFIWTRVSEDTAADSEWNDRHFGGTKSVKINTDDVKVRATFFCDLIDTTTRKSLLG
ncbi:MAG: phage tail protein [Clostridia bacterium]|nr:phage tail protein [Clostridia bacterium]